MNAAAARALLGATQARPLTQDEYDSLVAQGIIGPQRSGAPTDFGGTVIANPDELAPAWDSDAPAPMRLPNGVTLKTGEYHGGAQSDLENPVATEAIAPTIRTTGAETTGQPIKLPPGATLEPAPAASDIKLPPGATLETDKPDQGEGSFSDIFGRAYDRFKQAVNGDIPLTDYDAATLSGMASVARGTGHAIEGVGALLKPPSWDELKQALEDSPQNPGGAILARRMGKGLKQTAEQGAGLFEGGTDNGSKLLPAFVRDINASPDPTGTYLKTAQDTLGDAAGQAIVGAATEGATRGAGAVEDLATDPAVRAAAKAGAKAAAKTALKKIPIVGEAGKAGIDAAIDAYRTAKTPTATTVVEDPALTTETRSLPGQHSPERIFGPRPTPAAPIPPRSGLMLTGEVAPTVAKPPGAAGSIVESVTAPEPAAEPAPAPAPPKTTRAAISKSVDQAFGVEKQPPPKTVPGVTMRNQAAAQAAAAGELPEGFTATPKSSNLRGYKYDPATQEFDAITKTGQRYRHAGVTQEQFDAFEKHPSAGQAWNQLRDAPGVTPLGKVDAAGKIPNPRIKPLAMRKVVIDPETGRPEFSDALEKKKAAAQASPAQAAGETKPAAAAAGELPDPAKISAKDLETIKRQHYGLDWKAEDETPAWRDWLAQAKDAQSWKPPGARYKPTGDYKPAAPKAPEPAPAADAPTNLEKQAQASLDALLEKRGSIRTSAVPGDLLKRWGVDEESLASGREQTRGMSPKQTAEYTQKLVDRYKRLGAKSVDPIIETRDADNNIVEVDGRARALAAHKAGIERIPIIVRRIAAKVPQ